MTFSQPTPEQEDTPPTPGSPGTLIERPGVYHGMMMTVPHSPAQEAWFAHVCDDVETFIAEYCPERDPAHLPWISFAIHCFADALYERLGGEAHWAAVEVDDVLRMAQATDAMAASIAFRLLSAFYAHLGHEGLVPLDQARHWHRLFAEFARGADAPASKTTERRPRSKRAARQREKHARRKNRRR